MVELPAPRIVIVDVEPETEIVATAKLEEV